MARPISTTYTDEERDEIVSYVLVQTASGRFVSRIFKEDKTTSGGLKMPAISAFWRWVMLEDTSGELEDKLARAREKGIEAILDECGEIADNATNDYVERLTRNGEGSELAVDREHIQRSKLRIETRIKLAQMLKPKKYGPKLDLTSDGKSISVAEELNKARLRERNLADRKD